MHVEACPQLLLCIYVQKLNRRLKGICQREELKNLVCTGLLILVDHNASPFPSTAPWRFDHFALPPQHHMSLPNPWLLGSKCKICVKLAVFDSDSEESADIKLTFLLCVLYSLHPSLCNLSCPSACQVHHQDIASRLVSQRVTSISDIEWLKILRFNIGHDSLVMVHCGYTQLPFGYEYLGNTPRLVITPLTERAFSTMMAAVALHFGGAPEGPAGGSAVFRNEDACMFMPMDPLLLQQNLSYTSKGKECDHTDTEPSRRCCMIQRDAAIDTLHECAWTPRAPGYTCNAGLFLHNVQGIIDMDIMDPWNIGALHMCT